MQSPGHHSARQSRVTVPKRCHPAAKIVFAEMRRQGVTYDELEHRSGVQKQTFKAWRTQNAPGLDTISAALGALGWEFLPCPPWDAMAPEVRNGIEKLATEYGLDEDALLTALLREVASRPLNTAGHRRKPDGNASQCSSPPRTTSGLTTRG